MGICLHCFNGGCKDAMDDSLNEWVCKFFGQKIYRTLPDGAQLSDGIELFKNKILIFNKKYILWSEYSEVYQEFKTSENTNVENLCKFIRANRCWVKK